MKPGLTPSVLVLVSTAGMQRSTSCVKLCACNYRYGKWIYISAVFLRIAHLVAMRGIK